MISIIIPTLNEESVIEKTLRSLKSGLTIPHEIIISDGNSKDKTAEIAKRYANRVVVHSSQKRQTIAEGRNDGAAVASGEFFVFMDADCAIENPDEFFTMAIDNFKDPNLVALVARIAVLPDQATITDKIVFGLQNVYCYILNNFFHMGTTPGGEFNMIRRDVFQRLGGYNGNLIASEDLEMFSRLAKVGRTKLDWRLIVWHTGRRAHKIGWAKLLSSWFLNTMSMTFLGRAHVKEWKPIR